VPIISNSQDYPYITGTHWISKIEEPNMFKVQQHALDTGGANHTSTASDFTAVVIGFSSEPK
jgi:hypothetical protein